MRKVSVKRLFVLVCLYCLFANFAHPVTPTFIQNLHLHDYMFGVAFACMSFSNFFFSPLFGKIDKKFGPAKVAGFAHIGYGLSQLAFGLSTTELGIGLARFSAGFFVSAISVGTLMYVVDNSDEKSRGKNLAVNATIHAVVSTFGFLVGGFIGDYSIRLTFVSQAIGLAGTGVLWLLFLQDGKVDDSEELSLAVINPFRSIIELKDIITPMVVTFLIMATVSHFGTTCYEQCFNYFIKDQFGFPASYNGIVKAVIGIVALVANSTIAIYLMNKTDTFKSLKYVFLGASFVLVTLIFINNALIFVLVNLLFFACNAVYQPIMQNMLTRLGVKNNGQLLGGFNSMRSLGNVIGSLFAGFIYDLGPRLSFGASAIAFAVAILLTVVLNNTRKKEIA